MKTKKIISLLVSIIIVIGLTNIGYAKDISVFINDKKLEFDVSPNVINGRTFVPMRKIFESLGAVVSWEQDTQTATGRKGDTTVNITLNSKTLIKNGYPKMLDVAPVTINSRILVPVRAIAESFDCNVEWEQESQSVKITTNVDLDNVKTVMTASEISEKSASSVFYIEVYDANKSVIASGSGFFVTPDGVAVTNYHVIQDTNSAIITTVNGSKYNVNSIIAFDKDLDIAIIKVSKTAISGNNVSDFKCLSFADSDNIKAGQTVYAIGSPVGLQNTISNGIISNPKQIIGSKSFIQVTAPISHGSSGGALMNEYGEVLGITSSGVDSAQNIGFAIPINEIKQFNLDSEGVSYSEFAQNNAEVIIELSKDNVELNVGEDSVINVEVYSKYDDKINFEIQNTNVVECSWGEWKDNSSSISLYIRAVAPGTTNIAIYTNNGGNARKVITVNVKKPQISTYAGTLFPTYTAVTGMPLKDCTYYDESICYIYDYNNISVVQKYVDYLYEIGYTLYKESTEDGSNYYLYSSPNGELIAVDIAYKYNELWIFVGR